MKCLRTVIPSLSEESRTYHIVEGVGFRFLAEARNDSEAGAALGIVHASYLAPIRFENLFSEE
jgi:hypothetical protein